jgi:hypothetical protein
MEVSADTARFLLGLLNQQQLSIGAPDFDEALANVLRARTELQAVIEAAPEPAEITS